MRLTIAMLGFSALLAACATPAPRMTHEEWAKVVERDYPGVSKTQVFDAAERVLKLADEKDVQFIRNDDLLESFRDWSKFAVLVASSGTDYWTLSTREHDGGIHLIAQVTRVQRVVTATFNGGPVPIANVSNLAPASIQGNAIYDLFWARMDYLLGRRPDWPTCTDAKVRLAQGATYGSIDQLCNKFNIDDRAPSAPIVARQASTSG